METASCLSQPPGQRCVVCLVACNHSDAQLFDFVSIAPHTILVIFSKPQLGIGKVRSPELCRCTLYTVHTAHTAVTAQCGAAAAHSRPCCTHSERVQHDLLIGPLRAGQNFRANHASRSWFDRRIVQFSRPHPPSALSRQHTIEPHAAPACSSQTDNLSRRHPMTSSAQPLTGPYAILQPKPISNTFSLRNR